MLKHIEDLHRSFEEASWKLARCQNDELVECEKRVVRVKNRMRQHFSGLMLDSMRRQAKKHYFRHGRRWWTWKIGSCKWGMVYVSATEALIDPIFNPDESTILLREIDELIIRKVYEDPICDAWIAVGAGKR